jgi:membrane-associated phospholipid phosphatase
VASRRNQLLGAGAVLVLVGLLADARTPWATERTLGRWVYDWPDAVGDALKVVMNVGTLVAVVLVAAGLVVAGRYRAAGAAALAGFGGWLVASMLKAWVDRPRPSARLLGRVPREVVDNASWPSSHTTVAAALGTVLLLTVADRRIARLVVGLAVLLTALGRLWVGAHWALDVLGGMVLGTIAGALAVRASRA